MQTIDNIGFAGDICIEKVYAMRNICVTEKQFQCRHCGEDFQSGCPDYFPAYKTSVPIRKGFFANGNRA